MHKIKTVMLKGKTRKAAIALIAAVLAAGILIGTAGCGSKGDVSQAKKLMEQGDKYIADFESLNGAGGPGGNGGQPADQNGQDSRGSQDNRNTQNSQGNSGGQPSEADMEERAKEMEENTEKMKDYLDKAESAYKKILSLSGADAYKKYANKMLELVSAYDEQLSSMEEMAGNMAEGGTPPGNASDSSGNPPDMSNGTPPSNPANGTVPEDMQNGDRNMGPGGNQEIQTLKEEAEKIKEENNL